MSSAYPGELRDYYSYQVEEIDTDPLCCCEYYDRSEERNHILACCCNCADVDESFNRLISGRSIPVEKQRGMLLTFQDRLRIPWRGGAKQITVDNVLPVFLLVSLQLLAALDFYCSLAVFIFIPLLLAYLRRFLGRVLPKTKFFCLWLFWSGVYLVVLFESTVPLSELLPEENIAFVVLMSLSFLCFYKSNQRAVLNHVSHAQYDSLANGDSATAILVSDREDSDESDGRLACQTCRKYVPPRTYHCKICATCVVKQDHHNVWLNCCIGRANHRLFLLGCFCSLLALWLFANLSLTSVCHPTPIFTLLGVTVMLPDDCSDIYFQYDIALCFTGAIYALLMSLIILICLLKQICLISRGLTGSEWQRGEHINRRNCLVNWKTFCLGQ
ncbi:palmitoyltransferase ZDHHC23-B isoform X1 [Wyeomyia smithii]|uniref:palmitoyltransferase ZDHHC23-B isoform X1 n=2 Tax=Wyeomyia smithii TaxID=174621 RepID=UPI002467C0BB|nr:palmitoyltransferase ZDHHC23-B isoform X1 [Wyeomyia smithii]